MSEKKDKKPPTKFQTWNWKPQGEDLSQASETESSTTSQPKEESNQRGITTEVPENVIVGRIPPWDDDEDSQGDDKSKPPTITAEILPDEDKFQTVPRVTGEIPPWDDEEEFKR